MALRSRPNMQLIVPGGQVRPRSFTLMGAEALDLLRTLHVDLAMTGVHALSGLRLSETALDVASIKRGFIRAARRIILLADSSKLAASAFCEVCPIDLIHDIVCDAGLPDPDREALERIGARVTLVPTGLPT
jgi:DeoR family transcriptional regulator of aga operon